MTIDLMKYSLLLNEKFQKYTEAMNTGFNTLNKCEDIPLMSAGARQVYELISNDKEIPVGKYNDEDIEAAQFVQKEEQRRVQLLVEKKYSPFYGTPEIAAILLVSQEELDSIAVSEEEYNSYLYGEV